MQIARDASANQYARKAQGGYQIAALDMNGNATLNTVQAAAPEKLLLVIGGEDKSVGQFILNMADHIIGIHNLAGKFIKRQRRRRHRHARAGRG